MIQIIQRIKVGTPSGRSDTNNVFTLFTKMSFYHTSEVLGVDQKMIKDAIINLKFFPAKYRLAWTFLSMELLLKMFISKHSPHEIEERIIYDLQN